MTTALGRHRGSHHEHLCLLIPLRSRQQRVTEFGVNGCRGGRQGIGWLPILEGNTGFLTKIEKICQKLQRWPCCRHAKYWIDRSDSTEYHTVNYCDMRMEEIRENKKQAERKAAPGTSGRGGRGYRQVVKECRAGCRQRFRAMNMGRHPSLCQMDAAAELRRIMRAGVLLQSVQGETIEAIQKGEMPSRP